MRLREKKLGMKTKGLIYPVLFCGDPSELPRDAASRQCVDFSAMNTPDEIFRKHASYVEFDRAMQARRQIVFLLYSALGFTVIDILVCITSIPVTPTLLRSPADAMQVVVGAIALTSICLGFYARLIWAMVQPIARR